jgi:hypothetical protein
MGLSLQVFVHDSKMEFSTPRIHGYTYFYHLDPGATIFLRSQNFYFFCTYDRNYDFAYGEKSWQRCSSLGETTERLVATRTRWRLKKALFIISV